MPEGWEREKGKRNYFQQCLRISNKKCQTANHWSKRLREQQGQMAKQKQAIPRHVQIIKDKVLKEARGFKKPLPIKGQRSELHLTSEPRQERREWSELFKVLTEKNPPI